MEKIEGGNCGGSERVQSWGWISSGRQEKDCRVSMAGPGEPQQLRKHCLGLEQCSRLTQRGSTERWPCEEGEDEIEILHRQRLAKPGRAVGRAHNSLGVGRLAENTLSVPSKAWTQPPVGLIQHPC